MIELTEKQRQEFDRKEKELFKARMSTRIEKPCLTIDKRALILKKGKIARIKENSVCDVGGTKYRVCAAGNWVRVE